jgi:hypothetical protein
VEIEDPWYVESSSIIKIREECTALLVASTNHVSIRIAEAQYRTEYRAPEVSTKAVSSQLTRPPTGRRGKTSIRWRLASWPTEAIAGRPRKFDILGNSVLHPHRPQHEIMPILAYYSAWSIHEIRLDSPTGNDDLIVASFQSSRAGLGVRRPVSAVSDGLLATGVLDGFWIVKLSQKSAIFL